MIMKWFKTDSLIIFAFYILAIQCRSYNWSRWGNYYLFNIFFSPRKCRQF